MKILVAYATRHGATRGIAERIAQTLERNGLQVTLSTVEEARDLEQHDAFVIGSAAYMGHWLSPAADLVRRNRELLGTRPLWLFSSGPVGTELVDAKGRDVVKGAVPEEFGEFTEALHPRDAHIFFGAYDPDAKPIGLWERLGAGFLKMPAVREALPAGDFRDWPAIEAWAVEIARELQPVEAPTPVGV